MNRHFDKYIGPFGQIYSAIWTITFGHLDKYILTTTNYKAPEIPSQLFRKINFAISVILNTVCYWDKYVWLIGQIRFAIWTNKFCHLNKSVVLHRTPVLFNFLQCQQCLPGGITLTWLGLIFKDVKYFSFSHWPWLNFADSHIPKSLRATVWHASTCLWSVAWRFNLISLNFHLYSSIFIGAVTFSLEYLKSTFQDIFLSLSTLQMWDAILVNWWLHLLFTRLTLLVQEEDVLVSGSSTKQPALGTSSKS